MAIITCPDCNKDISNLAESCPHCGRPSFEAPKKTRSVSVLLGVGIVLLPIVFAWFTLRDGHTKKSKVISFAWLALTLFFALFEEDNNDVSTISSTNTITQEEIMHVRIGDILSAYENNEIGADNRYKGEVIQLTGIISSIKKDIMNNLYVTLGTGQQFQIPEIQAFFDDSMSYQLGRLDTGNRLTVVCRIDGLMMNIIAKNCIIK
ncbi:OB-fold protein [Oceanisphaera sp. IT1-181]|uniref:OB-fold protein n=1 Tax=Oceanisphaera sp. IT1-181 TaxID=3081199 RepID=UPI0029CA5641|nr:hypothetical protein [Oceanisphaera sp. IT1-181]